jgi:hypothetical protein
MNITLITSIIHTPNTPLSYIKTRSIYTREERFEQTKRTIETAREKILDNKIFLIECSQFTTEESDYLKSKVDIFMNIMDTNNQNLINRMFTPSKAMGEGTMTMYAIHYLFSNQIAIKNFFKISGRYWLTENFQYSNFDNEHAVIKYIDNDTTNALTSLYKLPQTNVYDWYEFLINSEDDFRKCIGYENIFAKFINKKPNVIVMDKIGVAGNIAVSGDLSDA